MSVCESEYYTHEYKIFGGLEDKDEHLVLLSLFNIIQHLSFLYGNTVLVDCFASGSTLGEQEDELWHVLYPPLSASFSQLAQKAAAGEKVVHASGPD